MNIKEAIPSINKYLNKDYRHIEPSENAHEGLCVPELLVKYGIVKTKIKSIPHIGHYMIGCITQLKKSYKEMYKQPIKNKLKISEKDLKELKDFIKDMGIGDIGFTEVDRSYIFSDKKILFKNAIVILMEMVPEKIKTVPSKIGEKEIFRTYYELNVAVNKIKNFLNERGYRAEAGPALGGEVNYPLLAEKAGLGAIGKHGLLITPEYGPSLRIAAIYTDIENLPLSTKNEHWWIREFCNSCNKCVRKCPANAIYTETKKFDDGSEQHIDYKKCAVPFSKDHGCTVCIKECVFFNGKYETIKNSYLK